MADLHQIAELHCCFYASGFCWRGGLRDERCLRRDKTRPCTYFVKNVIPKLPTAVAREAATAEFWRQFGKKKAKR